MVWLVPAPSHLNGALSPPSGNAVCLEARWVPPPHNVPLHLATSLSLCQPQGAEPGGNTDTDPQIQECRVGHNAERCPGEGAGDMVSDNTGPPETGLEKIRQKRSLLPPPPLTEKRLKGREAREASGGRSPHPQTVKRTPSYFLGCHGEPAKEK